jgi:hypothetical protein
MRHLVSVIFGLCVLGLAASAAFSLEIRVAPSTLVLSSGGGNLTVHTNVRFADANEVALDIDGVDVDVRTFADDRGFLVAQCGKDDAAAAIGPFSGTFTTATITLSVDGAGASEVIRVRK